MVYRPLFATPIRRCGVSTVSLPIIRGNIVLIDEEDYALVSQYSWHIRSKKRQEWTSYACVVVREPGTRKQRQLRMHRMIIDAPPHLDVHHINGNGLDNRRANLCLMARSEHGKLNHRHGGDQPKRERAKKPPRIRPMRRGVWYEAKSKKWRAEIRIPVGGFADAGSAMQARDARLEALGLDHHGIY